MWNLRLDEKIDFMSVSWGHEGRELVLLFKDQNFLFPLEAFIFWTVSCAFTEHGGLITVPALTLGAAVVSDVSWLTFGD